MREELIPYVGRRLAVVGTVDRFGCRPLFADLYTPTVCIRDVRTTAGDLLADHVWLSVGARLAAIDPQIGDVLAFRASVRPYGKHKLVQRRDGRYRYLRRTEDLTLRYPANIEKITTTERSN